MAVVSVDICCELSGRSSLCHPRNSGSSTLASSKSLVAPSALGRHHQELPQAHRSRQVSASPRCFAATSLVATSASFRSSRHPASLSSTPPGGLWGPQAARKRAAPALAQVSKRESQGDEEGLEYTWRKDKGSDSDSDSDKESQLRSSSSSDGNGSVAHEPEFLEGRQSLKRAMGGRVDASLRSLVR